MRILASHWGPGRGRGESMEGGGIAMSDRTELRIV